MFASFQNGDFIRRMLMEMLQDPVFLSRTQFAFTAMFHILWPLMTVGASLILVVFEWLWLTRADIDYYRHARFWAKLFLLNFSMGVISGLPMEFEFGANWSRFSMEAGEFFGNILGFEGAMAFMLEAGFLGIMLFGWQRAPRGIHFFATCMVAFGASLSAFWILVANSWMQTPDGIHIEDGKVVVDSYFDAIFNRNMPWGVLHMWDACLVTSLFVIGGLSAWYILHGRHTVFFLKSFRIALFGVIVAAPVQVLLGDSSGRALFVTQPAKSAAIEAHWVTNEQGAGASWNLLSWPNGAEQQNDWAISIPDVLSILATGDRHGQVLGLKTFKRADQPPAIPLIFYSFRVMVGSGLFFVGLMLWTSVVWFKGLLTAKTVMHQHLLLKAWVAAMPLGYLASECGWMVREVGRQPWVVYGILRTHDAASVLPAPVVATSLLAFVAVYTLLFLLFVIFAVRIIKKGPDLTLTPPLRN
ncbi:MAG: cytochrome ubiquinol oxidase subunit I [Methylococcales bacterium]|nr:cytochrome ubiquinol oxidase subunit I [Methylococcales bacterium]